MRIVVSIWKIELFFWLFIIYHLNNQRNHHSIRNYILHSKWTVWKSDSEYSLFTSSNVYMRCLLQTVYWHLKCILIFRSIFKMCELEMFTNVCQKIIASCIVISMSIVKGIAYNWVDSMNSHFVGKSWKFSSDDDGSNHNLKHLKSLVQMCACADGHKVIFGRKFSVFIILPIDRVYWLSSPLFCKQTEVTLGYWLRSQNNVDIFAYSECHVRLFSFCLTSYLSPGLIRFGK